MIKTALNVYKKNIWEVFSIIGIVAIALFAGLAIAIPTITNSLRTTYDSVVKTISDVAKHYSSEFRTNDFLKSLTDQFKALDWANPIQTLSILFKNNNLLNIVANALKASGLTPDAYNDSVVAIKNTVDALANDVNKQVWIIVASVGVGTLISYISMKIIVRFRATRYHHAGWFTLSLLLNIANLALICFITYLISTRISNRVGFCFALLGTDILLYILTFINALICYKPKEVRTKDLLNVKNIFGLFFANLIMLIISTLIIMIVAIFSDAIAILISIPLLIIVSVISECVVISYTEQLTIYYIIKNNLPMPKQFVKKDAEIDFIKKQVQKHEVKTTSNKK